MAHISLSSRFKATLLLLSALVGLQCFAPNASADAQALQGVEMSPLEIEVWNDPDFRRRFVESYIAETDVEPTLTLEERDLILEVNKLFEEGKLDETLQRLDESKTDSSSALLYFFTANIHMQKALNLDEPDADASEDEVKAFEAEQRNRLLKAADDFEAAVLKHKKYRRAWRNLGLVRVRLKQFEEARYALTQMITLGGGDADTYGLLGYCYGSLGDHLPAESAYRMANLLAPDQINWKMGLMSTFFAQQRFADASALCGQLLKDDPANETLWLYQANAYIALKEPGKAAENYEIIDGLGKSTVGSLSMLANIYTNQGLFDQAVDYYARALEMAGNSSEGQALLPQVLRAARVMSSQGANEATERAIAEIERIAGARLTDEDRKTLLMQKARIAAAEQASDRELELLREIVALDPLDGEALILLGRNSAREEDWGQAIFYFERAAVIEGFEADAKVEHAKALVKTERPGEAVPLLKAAQELNYRESVQSFLEAVEQMSRSN